MISLKNLNPRNLSNLMCTLFRLSTMFQSNFSGLLSTKRFASLAKVRGESLIAGVHNIQIAPSSVTPAIPAVLPLGTVKYTQKPLCEKIGMCMVGM